MNRNEAIEFLKRNEWGTPVSGWQLRHGEYKSLNTEDVITHSDVFESLQTRIETLLGTTFETEEKLLETIGSLWGDRFGYGETNTFPCDGVIAITNYSDKVWFKTAVSEKGDVQICILESLTRHPTAVPSESDLRKKIGQLLNLEFDTTDELLSHLANQEKRLVEPCSPRVDFETHLPSDRHLTDVSKTYGKPLRNANELIAAVYDLIPYRNTHREPQPKTYWDGVEPLRVGHTIMLDCEVVAVNDHQACVRNLQGGLVLLSHTSIEPHPFAKFTESEREFLQSQVEAGVIKLC